MSQHKRFDESIFQRTRVQGAFPPDEFAAKELKLREADVQRVVAHLISLDTSREEFAEHFARTIFDYLDAQDTNKFFGKMMSTVSDTYAALRETADLPEALRRLDARGPKAIFSLEKMLVLVDQISRTSAARKAAASRYTLSDPKQAAKAFVYSCWQSWEDEKSQYPSTAAFARDMLDKHPDTLTSQSVIEGWVRRWRKQ